MKSDKAIALNPDEHSFSFRKRLLFGALAISFYAIHGVLWVGRGVPSNLIWACHIGSVIVGLGLIFRVGRLNAIGILWLGLGNGMWILYLAGGGTFEATSWLTHVGGLVIGILGLRDTGFPRGSWLWALIGLAGLQQISRWTTVEMENVNLAFRVHPGWEGLFPSYGIYLAFLLVMAGLVFYGLEWMIRRKIA